MKPGTMPYSIGLSKLIPFIFPAGLISTISFLSNEKMAEQLSDFPLPEKVTSNPASSPVFHIMLHKVISADSPFSSRGTNSILFSFESAFE